MSGAKYQILTKGDPPLKIILQISKIDVFNRDGWSSTSGYGIQLKLMVFFVDHVLCLATALRILILSFLLCHLRIGRMLQGLPVVH